MKPLYQITNEYLHIYDELMNMEEISAQVIEDTLSDIKSDFTDKAINVAAFIKNSQAEVDAIQRAEAEMKKRRFRAENRIEKLKEYLISNLERCGVKKITKSPMFEIRIQPGPHSVIIDKESDLPSKFMEEEVFTKIKIREMSEELKNGKNVPGAHLEQKTTILIK